MEKKQVKFQCFLRQHVDKTTFNNNYRIYRIYYKQKEFFIEKIDNAFGVHTFRSGRLSS